MEWHVWVLAAANVIENIRRIVPSLTGLVSIQECKCIARSVTGLCICEGKSKQPNENVPFSVSACSSWPPKLTQTNGDA